MVAAQNTKCRADRYADPGSSLIPKPEVNYLWAENWAERRNVRLNSEFRTWINADILSQMPQPCSRRCRRRRNGGGWATESLPSSPPGEALGECGSSKDAVARSIAETLSALKPWLPPKRAHLGERALQHGDIRRRGARADAL
jgi:hypothetical protein